jgi:hypothetical protein
MQGSAGRSWAFLKTLRYHCELTANTGCGNAQQRSILIDELSPGSNSDHGPPGTSAETAVGRWSKLVAEPRRGDRDRRKQYVRKSKNRWSMNADDKFGTSHRSMMRRRRSQQAARRDAQSARQGKGRIGRTQVTLQRHNPAIKGSGSSISALSTAPNHNS